MDASLLKQLGQIAGIGGLSLGLFLLLFQGLLKNLKLPGLTPEATYKIVITFMVLVWSIAVIGIVAWLIGNHQWKELKSEEATARELSSRIYNANTPVEVDGILSEMAAHMQNGNYATRELFARELANLTVRYQANNKWDDQIRYTRNRMLELLRKNSRFPLNTYFQRSAFENMDLAWLDFTEEDVSDLSFRGAFLINSVFKDCELTNVSFRDAFLRGADFLGAKIETVDFRGSDWFLADGLGDETIKRLAKESRLSPCPKGLEELKTFHDARYGRVKFDNLTQKYRDEIISRWTHYQKLVSDEVIAK